MKEIKEKLDAIYFHKDEKIFFRFLTFVNSLTTEEQRFVLDYYAEKKLEEKNEKRGPIIIGLIGTPGAGKSTFVNLFLSELKTSTQMKKVGVLLIDPTSPLSGGAILGDRLRIDYQNISAKVFIRSISNQNDTDGLHPQIYLYLMLYSLFGADYILIESVGGGQASIKIKEFSDYVVVIFDPFGGDDIQHSKSGFLDIADEVIISKADITETKMTLASLKESISNSENKTINALNLHDVFQSKNFLKSFFTRLESLYQNEKGINLITLAVKQHLVTEFKNKLNQYFLLKKVSEVVPSNLISQIISKLTI